MSKPSIIKPEVLRQLPSVNQLMRTETGVRLRNLVGLSRLTFIARTVISEMRAKIRASETSNGDTRKTLLLEAEELLKQAVAQAGTTGIRRVINATGVILHTNLGRAPLSQAARAAVAREASGYCTLEFDAVSGSRGRRGARVEELLIELTGAEDALIVNNCAAASLLVLSVLAGDGETLVSRGELVEIGGDFRVPDVMMNSGTRMIEVGTTNRTHLDDYVRAINDHTRLVMRVHPSNYRIVGFTTSPSLSELAKLAREQGLFLFADIGSGALTDLTAYDLGEEPVIADCISEGADVVSFSGDKLLGAVQAGLIVGRREIVDQLRRHSLYRALRVDKLTLAALEASLESHRSGTSSQDIPALRMLALSKDEIEARAKSLIETLGQGTPESGLITALEEGESAVGAGSGPTTHPATLLISLRHDSFSADEIQRRLRLSSPPVISRISDGKVLVDLRTVMPEEEAELLEALRHLSNEPTNS